MQPVPEAAPAALAAEYVGGATTVTKLFVPIDAIDIGANVRQFMDPDFINRLAAAMREKGQTWPIKVQPKNAAGRYKLLAGGQRLCALKIVWVIEGEGDQDDAAELVEQIQENELRAGLRPCELAEGLERLRQLRGGCSSTELAKQTKLHLTTISRSFSLLKFAPAQRARIDAGELSETVAGELAKLPNDLQRTTLFEKASKEKWTRERAMAEVSQLTKRRKPKAKPATPLKRVALRLGLRGATVAVQCPEEMEEISTTEIVYALEYALKEAKRAMKLKVEARALAAHFQKLVPPAPKTPANGHSLLACQPAVEFPNHQSKE
jgi:ParB/RepB/Spo0J family partition protein